MEKIISDLKLSPFEAESELLKKAQKKFGGKINGFQILKKSLDARKKEDVHWVYTVRASTSALEEEKEELLRVKKKPKRVIVVGSGPAGLFCAVRLIERGIQSLLIERGRKVEEREKDVNEFFRTRRLNTESNVQFGEGGAGTFSDGKLNTQTNGAYHGKVLKTFLRFGAPKDIAYLSKPHIGSDHLSLVVKNMRNYILENGGEVLFSTRLTDICLREGKLFEAEFSDGRKIEASELVLALGHSARDTFEMLLSRGIFLEQKEFAVGFRVEHLQEEISRAQYGKFYEKLPPADYKLVSHASERAVFSFCMCPGGVVMPAASEEEGVVVNGMSNYLRNGVNANSALVAQVKKQDFLSEHPLAGVAFQRELERKAFLLGGKDYSAPVQRVEDFLKKRESSSFGEVLPSYAAGTNFARLDELLPPVLSESISSALPDMEKRLKGFSCPDAILSGVESRTSSPVRITRGENFESVSARGIYPIGEGAGYAGGITSAAVDGMKCADVIADKYCE